MPGKTSLALVVFGFIQQKRNILHKQWLAFFGTFGTEVRVSIACVSRAEDFSSPVSATEHGHTYPKPIICEPRRKTKSSTIKDTAEQFLH
jgi:hypothetical protein